MQPFKSSSQVVPSPINLGPSQVVPSMVTFPSSSQVVPSSQVIPSTVTFPSSSQVTSSAVTFPSSSQVFPSSQVVPSPINLGSSQVTPSAVTFPSSSQVIPSAVTFPSSSQVIPSAVTFPSSSQVTPSAVTFPSSSQVIPSAVTFPSSSQVTPSAVTFPSSSINLGSSQVFPSSQVVPSPINLGSSQVTPSAVTFPSSSIDLTSSQPFSKSEKDLYQTWMNLYRDPTLQLLDPISSWERRRGRNNQPLIVPEPLRLSPDEPIRISLETKMIDQNSPLLVANDVIEQQRYLELQASRDSYPKALFSRKLRSITNPFENLGNSSFTNRAAVKLANCDAIFGITGGARGGMLLPKDDQPLVYCDLVGAPGGFVQYLQYRLPKSVGYGISPKTDKESLQWDYRSLDMSRFFPTDGEDGSGDLIFNADAMANWILGDAIMSSDIPIEKIREGKNVDLVLADGSVDSMGKDKIQERLNFPLLVAETLTALQIIWKGGGYFLKFTNLTTQYSADLILLIANLFESTHLFKPISSRPGNNEFYLIAMGYKGIPLAQETIQVLRRANRAQREGKTVLRLLSGEYPIFRQQLKKFNQQMLDRQILVDQLKLKIYNHQADPSKLVPSYQIKYALAYWNILSADPIQDLRYQSDRDSLIYI